MWIYAHCRAVQERPTWQRVLILSFLSGSRSMTTAVHRSPKLLNQMRNKMRVMHYAWKTEQAYVMWIEVFLRFHRERNRGRWSEVSSSDRKNAHRAISDIFGGRQRCGSFNSKSCPFGNPIMIETRVGVAFLCRIWNLQSQKNVWVIRVSQGLFMLGYR